MHFLSYHKGQLRTLMHPIKFLHELFLLRRQTKSKNQLDRSPICHSFPNERKCSKIDGKHYHQIHV
jgi:hypothetical protein